MKRLKKSLILAAAILILQSIRPNVPVMRLAGLAPDGGGMAKVLAKNGDLSAEPSVHEAEELVHVELPTFPEEDGSVFDFIMDPQGLIEATGAAKYGGASFEEGGTLYFKNEEGDYAYSSKSDRLTVTNKSDVPVEVTVTAKLDDCGGLDMAEDAGFSDENAELFLALTDDRGTVMPLKGSEEISVTGRLDAASGQEAETYYSFGLVGACNPGGDWENVAIRPVVTVTWKVTPLIPEGKESVAEETGETEEAETAADETTAGESEPAEDGTKPSDPSDGTKPSRDPEVPESRDGAETGQMPDQSVSSNKL